MQNDTRETVRRATVRLTAKGGQGVLVPGPFVVTACHCVDFSATGGMALGDHFIEPLQTNDGATLKAAPKAVEAIADVAVLGSLDDQVFPEDAIAFQEWCEQTLPVLLCRNDYGFNEKFPVHVLSHKGEWITGTATGGMPNSLLLWVEWDQQIEGGTSGSPILNDAGEIVAIVSCCSEGAVNCNGANPRPMLALPAWILSEIDGSAEEARRTVFRNAWNGGAAKTFL